MLGFSTALAAGMHPNGRRREVASPKWGKMCLPWQAMAVGVSAGLHIRHHPFFSHTHSLSRTAPFIERAFHVWCFGLRKIQNEWVTPTQRGDISTAITLWPSPISLLKIWWISAGFVRGLSYPTSPVEANLRPAEILVKER